MSNAIQSATTHPLYQSGRPTVHSAVSCAGILPLYAAAHTIVDASSAAVVFAVYFLHHLSPDAFVGMLVLYHALAFGLQPIFGLAVDKSDSPRLAAIVGCLTSAIALLLPSSPIVAVVVAGLGNAVFHVGGAVICMRLTPHRAAAPGLFVAPGSAGLLLGTVLGGLGQATSALLAPIALVICLLMARAPVPPPVPVATTRSSPSDIQVAIGFVLLAIAIRSLLGFLVSFPWETHPIELMLLTAATVAGKALGGILADRCGWVRVGVGATLAAAPFLACAPVCPLAAIPGLLLLNLTMAVTLAALAEAVPGYPAFSFGLTCLALLLGALPSMLGVGAGGPVAILIVAVLSSLLLCRGLRPLAPAYPLPQTVSVCK